MIHPEYPQMIDVLTNHWCREMSEELLLPTIVSYSFAVESCEQAGWKLSMWLCRISKRTHAYQQLQVPILHRHIDIYIERYIDIIHIGAKVARWKCLMMSAIDFLAYEVHGCFLSPEPWQGMDIRQVREWESPLQGILLQHIQQPWWGGPQIR